jgi:glutaconyl-CoA/methylmalonyl-CoA decarboxylase subunit delta
MILADQLINFTPEAIDAKAVTLTVLGYAICFAALVLLYYAFSAVPRILRFNRVIQLRKKGKIMTGAETEIPADVTAAIALALYLELNEAHDPESDVITIRKINKAYSPWSSKIWSVRNVFNRP